MRTETYETCGACGRESLDCSRSPCVEVHDDRGTIDEVAELLADMRTRHKLHNADAWARAIRRARDIWEDSPR